MRHLLPVFLTFALSGCLIQEAEPFAFATDPHIMRGVYTGTVDTRYFFGDVELSADNKVLATSGGDNYSLVQLWDVETQTKIKTLGILTASSSSAGDVVLSADGSSVAVIYINQVKLWDTRTDQLILSQDVYNDEVLSCYCLSHLQLSADGKILAVGGSETDEVLVFDTAAGTVKHTFRSTYKSLSSLSLSADGRTLAVSSSLDSESGSAEAFAVNVWDVPTGEIIYTHQGSSSYDPQLTISRDGRRIAFVEEQVRVFGLPGGRALAGFALPEQFLYFLLRPDGEQLAIKDEKTIRIFAVPRGNLVETLPPELDFYKWSQDGTLLLSSGYLTSPPDVIPKLSDAVLVSATNFEVQSRFVSGELHGVRLELTPSYVSETRYELSGTLQVDQSEPVPIGGYVEGGDSQRYLAPTGGLPSFPLIPPPAKPFFKQPDTGLGVSGATSLGSSEKMAKVIKHSAGKGTFRTFPTLQALTPMPGSNSINGKAELSHLLPALLPAQPA